MGDRNTLFWFLPLHRYVISLYTQCFPIPAVKKYILQIWIPDLCIQYHAGIWKRGLVLLQMVLKGDTCIWLAQSEF